MAGTYYPAAMVRLHVRLDDGTSLEPSLALRIVDPGGIASLAAGALAAGAGSAVLAASFAAPLALGAPADPLSFVEGVMPQRVTVRRNLIREADEATVTIAAQYLPLDPRAIRALAVDVYMGAVSGLAHQQAMDGVPALWAAEMSNPLNLRFTGYAGEGTWDVGEGTVTLECQSQQQQLLDSKITAAELADIVLEQPLHLVVYQLVQSCPMARGMRVVMRAPVGTVPPIPGAAMAPHLFRVSGKKPGARINAEDKAESYWDIITRICLHLGWVPSVELSTVVVQPAKTLVVDRSPQVYVDVPAPAGPPTPSPVFGRVVPETGEALLVPRLVWGQDLEALTLSRAWAEARRAPIEVRSWVPTAGVTVSGRWPLLPTAAKAAPSGQTASEEVDTIILSGILSPLDAVNAAKAIWIERAHRDMRGRLETREMRSFGGQDFERPDVLDLAPGSSLEIGIAGDRFGGSTPERIAALTAPELIAQLAEAGFSAPVATAFGVALATTPELNTFRVGSCEHTYDVEDGYAFSCDFSAFLVIDPKTLAG